MTCVEDILNYGYIKNLANLRSHCLFSLSVYICTVYAHCTVYTSGCIRSWRACVHKQAWVFSWLAIGNWQYMYTRVQWFWLFFTFWGITTHPWHPKGPRIWKLAKNFFQLHAWPAEIFGKNRKMRFLGLVSKLNFRSPVWQIFTIFSACFIYGILSTHTKF